MDSSSREKIEKRAYELFVQRGGAHGFAMEDWLNAEKEILGAAQTRPKKTIRKRARKSA